mgnify:CR=1 FL=1
MPENELHEAAYNNDIAELQRLLREHPELAKEEYVRPPLLRRPHPGRSAAAAPARGHDI